MLSQKCCVCLKRGNKEHARGAVIQVGATTAILCYFHVMQCSAFGCDIYFHVTCAQRSGFMFGFANGKGGDVYCAGHTKSVATPEMTSYPPPPAPRSQPLVAPPVDATQEEPFKQVNCIIAKLLRPSSTMQLRARTQPVEAVDADDFDDEPRMIHSYTCIYAVHIYCSHCASV